MLRSSPRATVIWFATALLSFQLMFDDFGSCFPVGKTVKNEVVLPSVTVMLAEMAVLSAGR